MISLEDFLAWLANENEPLPTDCRLANWWTKSEPKAETVGDDGANSQNNTGPASTKAFQTNSNDFEFSGLLNIPKKIDAWFRAIDDMTKDFYDKFNKIPNETQAWARLQASPPEGYEITTGTDKGEDCIFMPGFKPLSKSAFFKRWENYTANKA